METPAEAVTRLFDAYDSEDLSAYGRLLTQDFSFRFSRDTDPGLEEEYRSRWGLELELTAAEHLFSGYSAHAGASTIFVSSFPTQTSDLTRLTARVSGTVAMDIQLEDDTSIHLSSPIRIDLVRGDAASLGSDQPADSTVWYVKRIEDRSREVGGPRNPREGEIWTTFGGLRGRYVE
jgi:hypothetical protein